MGYKLTMSEATGDPGLVPSVDDLEFGGNKLHVFQVTAFNLHGGDIVSCGGGVKTGQPPVVEDLPNTNVIEVVASDPSRPNDIIKKIPSYGGGVGTGQLPIVGKFPNSDGGGDDGKMVLGEFSNNDGGGGVDGAEDEAIVREFSNNGVGGDDGKSGIHQIGPENEHSCCCCGCWCF